MKQLWNKQWKFKQCELDTSLEQVIAQAEEMEEVILPHDWLIADCKQLYADGTGWYHKTFSWHSHEGQMLITFDGIYMDSTIYVNQREVGQWKYGYSSFTVNITAYLQEGENEIWISVRHQSPNSRWYSGAGIYRNVWMRLVKNLYLEENGLYVHTQVAEQGYELLLETNVVLEQQEVACALEHHLYDSETGQEVFMKCLSGEEKETVYGHMEGCSATGTISPNVKTIGQRFLVEHPKLWSPDEPACYQLETYLYREGVLCDRLTTTIGFKTVVFDANEGLFLNGRNLKLNGVCEHHDLGALGVAFHVEAQRRKYRLLKDMGVNAIRFAHNMPAPECLALCDEMGFLVIDEALDMWEMPKTKYDYARFFPQWIERDMESFVRRDRNHVCLLMWSIGNEIPDTHEDAKRGRELTQMLVGLVRKFDPLGNGKTTFASNYLPWDNTQSSAEELDVVGYNYTEHIYEEHHKKYPNRIIYGSETASMVFSRGVYHFPLESSIPTAVDEQCSALGNSTTNWGAKSLEDLITQDRDMPFSLGQFLWTGTDYIGEPTPYHTKNSYFGQIDTAGFPKDSYYVFQAAWTDYHKHPMIHVFPYWDFNEGQLVDIRVCSNAPMVELFCNGVSYGKRELSNQPGSGKHVIADYQIPYHKGSIWAVAYDEEGNQLCKKERSSFKDAVQLVLKPDKQFLQSDQDLQFITITAVDEEGYRVANASNRVRVEVSGGGKLVGLDNGDSTDEDSYKGNTKKLFRGKLLAIVTPSGEEGPIMVSASFDETEIPVRKIELYGTGVKLTPTRRVMTVSAKILPETATDQGLVWKAVNHTGVEVNLVEIEQAQHSDSVLVRAVGDGKFKLRCMSRSGDEKRFPIISELDMEVCGFGLIEPNS